MRDPAIAEAAAMVEAHFNGKTGFANAGLLNGYQCEAVTDHLTITIDREPGVTPFTTPCPVCAEAGVAAIKGLYRTPTAQSSMYRMPAGLTPTHEWYRPDSLEGLSGATAQHVLNGGLILRKIGDQS